MPPNIFLLNDYLEIPREKFSACLEAIYTYHRKVAPTIECPGGVASFLAPTVEEKLVEAMAYFDWNPMVHDDGISGVDGSPRRINQELLEAIAPYVTAQSVIEYIDEEGKAARFSFNGQQVICETGTIVYTSID